MTSGPVALLATLLAAAPADAPGDPFPGPIPEPPAGTAGPEPGATPAGRPALRPEISAVVGLAMVHYDRDVAGESPRDPALVAPAGDVRPLLQGAEVAIQASAGRSARADVFLLFARASAEVAEAYLTALAPPAGLRLRAGKLRSPFGLLNPQHAHQWEFADPPLVVARLLGPSGLSGAGADLAWRAPLPWPVELTVAWQEASAGAPAEGRSTGFARLLASFDLAGGTSLALGLSGSTTAAPPASSRSLAGADLLLRIGTPRRAGILDLQGEVLVQDPGAAGGAGRMGGYGQAVWRASRRWAVGLRYDDSPAFGGGRERRGSALAAFLPGELQRLRAQVAQDRLPGGRTGLEVILHLEFGLGPHGARPLRGRTGRGAGPGSGRPRAR